MPETPATLGPYRLTVDADRARAYAREIGADGVSVPLSYPAVWLTEPALFDPVRELCAALGVVPVHESQSFVYDAPLVAGESYNLSVTMRREPEPARLVLDAVIAAPDGAPVAKIETMLRLVSRKAFGAAI